MQTQRYLTSIRRSLVVSVLVLVTCHLSLVTPVSAQELKIGSVNVAKLFDEYERTKQLDRALEQKGQQKETELSQKVGELKKLREGLELLNEDARASRQLQAEERADELQRFRRHTAQQLRRERDEAAQSILQEIEQVVQEYAAGNGFAFILDGRSILYGTATSDVTGEVLTRLNARFAKGR